MATIPAKVCERLSKGLRRFQPILNTAKSHDAIEANTSTIAKEILSDLFGYDKFTDITAEFMIKGTFCDIAIKLDGRLSLLVEVKAIGLDLKEAHSKQAIDYAANQGVDWVVLTNGAVWRIYEVIFGKPISQELICEFDLLSSNPKSRAHLESLFLLTKEGLRKGALREAADRAHATSRYNLAAIVLSDDVLNVLRRLVRKSSPKAKVDKEALRWVLKQDVLKREVTEGEQAEEAWKRFGKKRKIKAKAGKEAGLSRNGQSDEQKAAAALAE